MLPTDCSPALACPMRGHGDWWGCEAAGRRVRRLVSRHIRRAHAARAPPLPPLSAHPLQAQCRLRCSVFPPRARWARLVRAEAGAGGGHGRAGGVAPVLSRRYEAVCLPVLSPFLFASPLCFFCGTWKSNLCSLFCVRFFQSCKLEVVLCELHVGNSCRQHGRCLPVWLVQLDERALNGERFT